MKLKVALFLSAVAALSSLAAGSKPTEPPATEQPKGKSQIARGGEMHDEALGNRANRAGEMGDTQREENLENRQSDAEQRQEDR